MDARHIYGLLVFTLLVSSAIFLAGFVVFQWARGAPKIRKVASVAVLYVLLFVLLVILYLPIEPFDATLLTATAVALAEGIILGMVVGGIFSVARRIIRRRRRLRADEEQQLAEKKQLAEEGERLAGRRRLPTREELLEEVERRAAESQARSQERQARRNAQKKEREEEQRKHIESLLHRNAVRDDINYMSGAQFEEFMAGVLRQKGYAVEKTKATGDQGVDLLLPDFDGKRIAVQLKRYTGPVGNSAVQATFAGMGHYRAEQGWVINLAFNQDALALSRRVQNYQTDITEFTELDGVWLSS